jgi:DNA-binding beta-propeller fold protein YncE
MSDCTKVFVAQNRTRSPSDNSDSVISPTISPTTTKGSSWRQNGPIVDRDDNKVYVNNTDGSVVSSSNDNTSDVDNDGRFEGLVYVIISSALGVIFFTGTGYYYITQHLQEQHQIMALQEANNGKYPKKQKEAIQSGTKASANMNQNYRTDVEDLSQTAEDDEDDDDSEDALYVIHDARMLEI